MLFTGVPSDVYVHYGKEQLSVSDILGRHADLATNSHSVALSATAFTPLLVLFKLS